MIGATLDTNIYVSALEFGGIGARLLGMARVGEFRLDVSDLILDELISVLRDDFEGAQTMANHPSSRATKIYDRWQGEILVDELERIGFRPSLPCPVCANTPRTGSYMQSREHDRMFLLLAFRFLPEPLFFLSGLPQRRREQSIGD